MCLRLQEGYKVETAEEDIVCYKVMKCRYKEMYTFYQGMKVEDGKEYTIDYDKFPTHPDCDYTINGNAFHSYKYKKDAVAEFKKCINNIFCVVKCVIPKGSRYWEGKFDCTPSYPSSYASEKIKYCEVIIGNEIPKDVKIIYESDEVIGIDFLKFKKRILFKDARESMSWDDGMAYAESLGMSLPTADELREMKQILDYFWRVIFKDKSQHPIWSSRSSAYLAWHMGIYGCACFTNKCYGFAVVPCADLTSTN